MSTQFHFIEDEQAIMVEIFRNVNFCTLLKCRLVNKKWNDLITNSSKISSRFAFIFDGDCRGDSQGFYTSCSILVGSKPFWRNFRFMNLDMSVVCLANVDFFEYFVLKFRLILTKLVFENCKGLSIGRLVELLAYCKELETIGIVECPHLFETSVDNWKKFLPSVEKNLRNLRDFGIIEKSKKLKFIWPDVIHLLHNLRRLAIYTEVGVAGKTIVSLVTQNRNLFELDLSCGQLTLEEFRQIFCSGLQLRVLHLCGMNLPTNFPFSTPAVKNLDCLGLHSCHYIDNSEGKSAPKDLFFRCKKISRLEFSSGGCSGPLKSVICNFFSNKKSYLKDLILKGIPGENFPYIFIKTPNLTHLQLCSQSSERLALSLSPVCNLLPNLQVLDLQDVNILLETDPPKFSALSSLRQINVSNSNLGDYILQALQTVKSLRDIRLENTMITFQELERFIKCSKVKLPKLEQLHILDCQQCTPVDVDFVNLINLHAPKNINASCSCGYMHTSCPEERFVDDDFYR